jgi:predicted NBD/HSP70 family sugar kinase
MPIKLRYEINEDARRDKYVLGVELAASQLRVAALGEKVKPDLREVHPFGRTQFYAVGSYDWPFEPQRSSLTGKYEVSADDAETVCQAIGQFLKDRGIDVEQVDEIHVGVIIGFDESGLAQVTDTELLRQRLADDFGDMEFMAANRTRSALQVEHGYGAGVQIRPSHNMLYVTISRNLNFDALLNDVPTVWPGGIFAPGIRHSHVDPEDLEQMWHAVFGDSDYEAPELDKCAICRNDNCLHRIASGQGIVDLVAAEMATMSGDDVRRSEVGQWMRTRQPAARRPFVRDRGAVAKVGPDGVEIDTAAVFRASPRDPRCRRVVNQAAVAIGLTIVQNVLKSVINLGPQLIVLGGTVPAGVEAEDIKPIEERDGVDAVVQRVLAKEGFTNIPVTRSRFSGFTGLLGVTLLPE